MFLVSCDVVLCRCWRTSDEVDDRVCGCPGATSFFSAAKVLDTTRAQSTVPSRRRSNMSPIPSVSVLLILAFSVWPWEITPRKSVHSSRIALSNSNIHKNNVRDTFFKTSQIDTRGLSRSCSLSPTNHLPAAKNRKSMDKGTAKDKKYILSEKLDMDDTKREKFHIPRQYKKLVYSRRGLETSES